VDPVLIIVASTFLAILLTCASLHKLRELSVFRATLVDYQLLPGFLVVPASMALPAAEMCASIMLLIDPVRAFGALFAIALFGLYAVAIAINLLRGRHDIACGCAWGLKGAQRRLDLSLVVRNGALIALSCVALADATRQALWIDRLDGLAGGIGLAILCAAIGQLLLNHRSIQLRRIP
jgi:hypothetical protein